MVEVDPSQLDSVENLWIEKKGWFNLKQKKWEIFLLNYFVVELLDDLAPVGPTPLIENDDHNVRA